MSIFVWCTSVARRALRNTFFRTYSCRSVTSFTSRHARNVHLHSCRIHVLQCLVCTAVLFAKSSLFVNHNTDGSASHSALVSNVTHARYVLLNGHCYSVSQKAHSSSKSSALSAFQNASSALNGLRVTKGCASSLHSSSNVYYSVRLVSA